MTSELLRPLRIAGVAFVLAAAIVPVAQAQDEEFIPGYSDFPNALRIESDTTFVPGHSDFPNHLRVQSTYDRSRANAGVDETVVLVPTAAPGGFDWLDAGIGAGGALGLVLLAIGGTMLVLHRRPTRSAALAG